MQLRNTFAVAAAPDAAYTALLDLERVAPCMPGARLTGSEGDTYHGQLKLKIGPITAAYQGTLTIDEADEQRRTARLSAVGEEIGGQGAARAEVTATVRAADQGGGSLVEVITDLDIRGKAAQFGRGALGEVTQRVLDQFARNLEATFTAADADGRRAAPGDSAAHARQGSPSAADPAAGADLDVVATILAPMAKQAAPAFLAFLLGLVVGRLSGRGTGRHAAGSAWPIAPYAEPCWGPPPWWQPPADPTG